MPDGGAREAELTADYNAEMVEQITRFPRLRDRSLFVGNPDDVVPDGLRPAAARHPRVDPRALRLRRLRHGLRPGEGGSTGPTSAIATTSGSAS